MTIEQQIKEIINYQYPEDACRITAMNIALAEIKLPRIRYVDRDGLPTKEDGWCICVFKRADGSYCAGNYNVDMLTLERGGFINHNLYAWLPESEFLAAFVEDGK